MINSYVLLLLDWYLTCIYIYISTITLELFSSPEFTSWTFSPERVRSFAAFPIMQQHAGDVSVSLWLKSRQLNGLVLQLQRDNQAYLTVFLNNGSLYIAIYNSIRRASSFLTDGEKVFVSIKKERGVILFNQTQQVFAPRELIGFEVEAGDVAYLGGLPEGERGGQWGGYLKGCLQDVRIDDTQLYMYSGSISHKPQHPSYLPRNSSNVLEGCAGDQTCKVRWCFPLLFSKDAFNCSNVTVKTFIMLQTISISNKHCSFELSIHQRTLKN